MNNSNRCLYNNSFKGFLDASESLIYSVMDESYHGVALTTTRDAWRSEIAIMKSVVAQFEDKNACVY